MDWYKKFNEIEKGIEPNDRIHITSSPQISMVNKTQTIETKPDGLWYACGTEWIRFVKTWEGVKEHIFKMEINPSVMLMISNNNDLDKFSEAYGLEFRSKFPDFPVERDSDSIEFIDWPKVAEKYSGIEISPYQGSRRMDPRATWYYGWDVASGCIWKSDALVNIARLT